jgi:hydrophobic/amphiphilic exporter-1 (mainly G- bacteria), HAE1 family
MKLVDTAVRRPVLTVMMVAVLIVLGIFSFTRLTVELFPKVDIPVVSITTIYEGAGPKEVESQVTEKIEDEVSTVSNVKTINSTSMENYSIITVEFNVGTNIDFASIEIKDKVDAILNKLPEGIERPSIVKFDLNALPIMSLSVSADRPLNEVYDIADNEVRDRLNQINGLASIDIVGGLQREIQVNVKKEALLRYGLDINSVASVIGAENRNIPVGRLTRTEGEYTLRVQGEYATLSDLAATTIATPKGGTVTIGDIATVKDSFKERRDSATFNGKPSVGVIIYKRSDANTVSVATNVYLAIRDLKKTLPESYEIGIASDYSTFITQSVNDVIKNIILGILITALFLYIFLHNLRFTFIVSMTMPTCIVSSFILINAAGFSLNMMTLMALGISVGMLVNDSLLILENIDRHVGLGETPAEAAKNGASEIALAVSATTMTHMVVFTPIAFMGGIIGQFFRQFGITVVFITAISLLCAFTLTPMLASKLLGKKMETATRKPARNKYLERGREIISGFFGRWDTFYESVKSAYGKGLVWCLDHPKRTALAVLGLFFLSFVMLFMVGGEFTPYSDQGYMSVDVTLPSRTNLEDTERVMAEIAVIAEKHPEIESTFISIGGENKGINEGQLTIKMVPLSDRDMTTREFVNVIRPELASIPSADIIVSESSSFSGKSEAAITVDVTGPDLDAVKKLSNEMLAFMYTTKGLTDIATSEKSPKPEYRFIPDRYRISSLGINTSAVYSALRTSFEGEVPSVFRDKSKEYDIRVRLAEADRTDVDSFSGVMIGTPKGVVPVGRLGDMVETTGDSEILRKNRNKLIELTANIGSGTLSDYEAMIKSKRGKMDIPQGYDIALAGESENKAEAFGSLFQALFMSIILVYILLAAMLESYVHPFTIMLSLPLGLVGVATALFIGRQTINIQSMMAIVMLVGIVVNNSILILENTGRLRDEGIPRRKALVESCNVKFRPLAMANLAIACSLIPQIMGGADTGFQKSMAVATIGGILTAGAFTLFFIPVIYEYLDRFTKQGRLEREKKR